ncbi:hypothetical protein [Streptomyces huasconensis]|uniref:hypothetical protein n=1 Tax=Streptomyces huasconensis TaxID=1854574 RepID=UPI0036F684A0
MTTTVREAPHHDTLTCYTDYGCRRPACMDRKRRYQRELRRRENAGQPALIDAGPVRQHVLRLQAEGVTIYSIAAAAGVHEWTIRSLFPGRGRGRKNSVSPETATKILAVTAERVKPGYTESTGTIRRIQALAAKGWPLRQLAVQLGINPTYAGDLIRRASGNHLVYAATAEKVASAYETLKKRNPARCGIAEHLARQARERAKAKRWAPPSYWDKFPDAIDDPHFTPLYGVSRGALLAADGRELMRVSGLSYEQAAERLGITRNHLQQAMLRHPETDAAGHHEAVAA